MVDFVFRSRMRRAVAAASVALFAAAAWFCFPALRLAARSVHPDALPAATPGEWVDPHRYDAEWFDAARAGRVDILRALVQAHYPIDTQTSNGYSALILAAYDEQPAALAYLLEAGADACLADRYGNTALMGALYKGYDDIARTLIAAACPIDQANHAGETALSFATLFGRLDLVPDLVAKGARVDHTDGQGDTPLAVALRQGNHDAIVALRRAGADR